MKCRADYDDKDKVLITEADLKMTALRAADKLRRSLLRFPSAASVCNEDEDEREKDLWWSNGLKHPKNLLLKRFLEASIDTTQHYIQLMQKENNVVGGDQRERGWELV